MFLCIEVPASEQKVWNKAEKGESETGERC